MISVDAPASAPAGSVVYATATGYSSSANVEAEATFGGDALTVVLTQKPVGAYQACVSIPAGAVGTIDIEFGDGRRYGSTSIKVG